MREILGVFEVFLGVFEKTKERKDRVGTICQVGVSTVERAFFFWAQNRPFSAISHYKNGDAINTVLGRHLLKT